MTVRTAPPGTTEVKEIRTRFESDAPPREERLPELWDYADSLTDADWASQGYRFVIERGRPEWKAEDRVYIGDFFEKITPADIAKRWGGGEYTIWFKIPPKGQQLKYKKGLKVDGAPLTSTVGASSNSHPGQQQNYGDPLSRLIDVMDRRLAQMELKLDSATGNGAASRAVEQAVGLTGQVFSAATTAATGTLQNIAGGGSSRGSVTETLELLKTAKELFGPPSGGPVSNSVNDFLGMLKAIKDAGLMGAPAQGGVAAQIAIEGIRALPSAITEGVKGLEHWHLAEEARARQLALQRGGAPINVTPQQPASAAAPPPPPPPVNNAAAAAAPAQGSVQVNIETIEIAMVRIITNQSYTIEEAATRCAAFMQDLVPGMPDQLAAAGEAQLLRLFQERPILQQIPQNPRLSEFIKAFIAVVRNAPVINPAPANVPPA